jgi:hypothetical protein
VLLFKGKIHGVGDTDYDCVSLLRKDCFGESEEGLGVALESVYFIDDEDLRLLWDGSKHSGYEVGDLIVVIVTLTLKLESFSCHGRR